MKPLSIPQRPRFSAASLLLPICLLAALLAFLAFPARCLAYVADGISLWATSVLPAALPFLFLTGLLTGTPLFLRLSARAAPLFRPFGVPGQGGCAAMLSLLSGYPAGAKAVERLCARTPLSPAERFRCACLATTSGPAFLVGVAGTAMAGSPALGWLLFGAHVIGIFAIALVLGRGHRRTRHIDKRTYRDYGPAQNKDQSSRFAKQHAQREENAYAFKPIPLSQALPETLASSVLAVLTVGGAVALFYAFGRILTDVLSPLALPKPLTAFLAGLLEMTAGCAGLLSEPTPLRLALAAFLVTFGGLCVLVQQWSFLAKIGIPFAKFLLVKLCQAVLAGGVCFLFAVFVQS